MKVMLTKCRTREGSGPESDRALTPPGGTVAAEVSAPHSEAFTRERKYVKDVESGPNTFTHLASVVAEAERGSARAARPVGVFLRPELRPHHIAVLTRFLRVREWVGIG